MRSTGSWLLLGVAISLAAVVPARATINVGIYSDPDGLGCEIRAPQPGGTTHAYVLVKFNTGMTGTQFRIDWPACSPYALESWSVPAGIFFVGDPLNGIQITPSGCMLGDFVALDLVLRRIGDPTGC